jgi:hypothetical protein
MGIIFVYQHKAMSYHLSSQTTVSREKFSRDAWTKLLSLAISYGWQPMGTLPPSRIELYGMEPEDWDGVYLTNDGQTVTAEDAWALAVALEKSLDDIPDFNIELGWGAKSRKEDDQPDVKDVHPFEYFAGDEKQHLIEFIKFCRLGSFIILRI